MEPPRAPLAALPSPTSASRRHSSAGSGSPASGSRCAQTPHPSVPRPRAPPQAGCGASCRLPRPCCGARTRGVPGPGGEGAARAGPCRHGANVNLPARRQGNRGFRLLLCGAWVTVYSHGRWAGRISSPGWSPRPRPEEDEGGRVRGTGRALPRGTRVAGRGSGGGRAGGLLSRAARLFPGSARPGWAAVPRRPEQ